LDVFEEEQVLERLATKIALLGPQLEPVAGHGAVAEIRRRGFMTGIQLVDYPLDVRMGHQVTLEARKRGAIIRPLGDVVILMPPLAISEADLRRLVEITAESIDAATAAVELPRAA
jgi:adenosylmethionine-8-amino-7-oxononanoate aminotransferase